MSRHKKPRSKTYKRRPISTVGGLFAIGGVHIRAEERRPIRDDQVTDLSLAYRLALEAMTRGDSNEQDWSTVVCSLNIGLILCERGIGAEFEQKFIAALDGAFRARLRAGRTSAWRFDGEALLAIREAFAIHDEQIKVTAKEEMRLALLEVHRRIDEGHVYQAAA